MRPLHRREIGIVTTFMRVVHLAVGNTDDVAMMTRIVFTLMLLYIYMVILFH